jgi:hypothetical protein
MYQRKFEKEQAMRCKRELSSAPQLPPLRFPSAVQGDREHTSFWQGFRKRVSDLVPRFGPLHPRYVIRETLWETEHEWLKDMIAKTRGYLKRRAVDEVIHVIWTDYKFRRKINRGRPPYACMTVKDPIHGQVSFSSEGELRRWVGTDPRRVWAAGLYLWYAWRMYRDQWTIETIPQGTWKVLLDVCMNDQEAPADVSLAILSKVIGLSPTRIRQMISRRKPAARQYESRIKRVIEASD